MRDAYIDWNRSSRGSTLGLSVDLSTENDFETRRPWIRKTSPKARHRTTRCTRGRCSDAEERPENVSPSASLFCLNTSVDTDGDAVPTFSVHPEELQESTKKKLNDRGYFYANSDAGLGWTDRANRETFYRWRIIPRTLVDTNVRDLTSASRIYQLPRR